VELLEGTIPPENRAGRWGLANNYNNHEWEGWTNRK
jgi:hypothetical protein